MDKRKEREQVLSNLIALAVLILFLFPIYWMVITSFESSREVFAEVPTFSPKKIELEGYTSQLFIKGSVPIWVSFGNSSVVAAATAIISTLLAILSAYGLARFKLSINRAVLLAILIIQMLPTALFLSSLFTTFKKIIILDALAAPVIFTCLHNIPFCIIALRSYFLGIPKELEDAAIIDGCGQFQVFWRVMVPITYPGIVISAAFTFLWGWGDLMGALIFIKTGRLYPLTVNVYKVVGEYGIEWNSLMAFAVILTIPVLLIFMCLQKYPITGITTDAVEE